MSEDDQIYYITCSVVNGDKPKDFVVLVSRRKPLKDKWVYLAHVTSLLCLLETGNKRMWRQESHHGWRSSLQSHLIRLFLNIWIFSSHFDMHSCIVICVQRTHGHSEAAFFCSDIRFNIRKTFKTYPLLSIKSARGMVTNRWLRIHKGPDVLAI